MRRTCHVNSPTSCLSGIAYDLRQQNQRLRPSLHVLIARVRNTHRMCQNARGKRSGESRKEIDHLAARQSVKIRRGQFRLRSDAALGQWRWHGERRHDVVDGPRARQRIGDRHALEGHRTGVDPDAENPILAADGGVQPWSFEHDDDVVSGRSRAAAGPCSIAHRTRSGQHR